MCDIQQIIPASASQCSTGLVLNRTWDSPPPFEGHARRISNTESIISEVLPPFSEDRPPPYKRVVFNITPVRERSTSLGSSTSPECATLSNSDLDDQRMYYARRHRQIRQNVQRSYLGRSPSSSNASDWSSNYLYQETPVNDTTSSGWSRLMLESLFGYYLSESKKRKFSCGYSKRPRKSIPFNHPVYEMSADEQVKLRSRGIDPVAVAELKASGRPTPV